MIDIEKIKAVFSSLVECEGDSVSIDGVLFISPCKVEHKTLLSILVVETKELDGFVLIAGSCYEGGEQELLKSINLNDILIEAASWHGAWKARIALSEYDFNLKSPKEKPDDGKENRDFEFLLGE